MATRRLRPATASPSRGALRRSPCPTTAWPWLGSSTIVSLGLGIGGVVCSLQGKRRVDAGETPKHGGLAQAGLIIGWVGIGLSILAIVAWIAVIALSAGEDDSIFNPDTTRAMREAVGA
jgi:hypothetical protein